MEDTRSERAASAGDGSGTGASGNRRGAPPRVGGALAGDARQAVEDVASRPSGSSRAAGVQPCRGEDADAEPAGEM